MKMVTKIDNDSHLLKELSKDLVGALKAKSVEEDIIFDIHVAFEEALRNAMVHGNKNDPQKQVTVEMEVTDTYALISVEDEGKGFNHEKLPDPTFGDNLLKESGRGVYLIKHLMDEAFYDNGGRRVTMKKIYGGKNEGKR